MRRVKGVIPKYAIIPIASALFVNFLVYYCSRILTNRFVHIDLSSKIDTWIPYVSFFIIIYVLAYIQWIVGYIVISKESKQSCYQFMSAEIISKLICLLFFVFLPTTMVRATGLSNGLLDRITKIVYLFDDPVNLFPSIHCLESYLCFRGALFLKSVSKGYKYFTLIFAILVFLSVVFVKQHVFIDIIGGIIVGEVGLWLSQKFRSARLFEKLEAILKF